MYKDTVIVGLSGGVDSSVTALLLKEQGFLVIGVTIDVWQGEEARKTGEEAIRDAKKVCDYLGIEHRIVDMKAQFKKNIMDYFVSEYLQGRTPNPCNMCNHFIKWYALKLVADELGAKYIATGHYAKIERLANGRLAIANSKTAEKDQTYALSMLTQEDLERTIMPLGQYEKSQVREMAENAGIPIAAKKDSQDICFIPDKDYSAFIEGYSNVKLPPKGNFVDRNGKILGEHLGISHYTIGQRKGLNIALGHPAFVLDINPMTNEVTLGDNDDLFRDRLVASKINYMGIRQIQEDKLYLAKVRYAHKGTPCYIKAYVDEKTKEERIEVAFVEGVRAITKGQNVVVYDGEFVALSGVIEG